jgi:hypothetical protein
MATANEQSPVNEAPAPGQLVWATPNVYGLPKVAGAWQDLPEAGCLVHTGWLLPWYLILHWSPYGYPALALTDPQWELDASGAAAEATVLIAAPVLPAPQVIDSLMFQFLEVSEPYALVSAPIPLGDGPAYTVTLPLTAGHSYWISVAWASAAGEPHQCSPWSPAKLVRIP